MVEKTERLYTIPLSKAYDYTRTKRTPRAVKLLREFIAKHMKAKNLDIILSNALNSYLWQHSIQRPPRKVKVRAIKEETGVKVFLPDEKVEEKKSEEKKLRK
jgi:large subunit ribosomal protein L31e